jgi:hypothetical protein
MMKTGLKRAAVVLLALALLGGVGCSRRGPVRFPFAGLFQPRNRLAGRWTTTKTVQGPLAPIFITASRQCNLDGTYAESAQGVDAFSCSHLSVAGRYSHSAGVTTFSNSTGACRESITWLSDSQYSATTLDGIGAGQTFVWTRAR